MNKSGPIQINNRMQTAVPPPKEKLWLRLDYDGQGLLPARGPNA